MAEYRVTSSTHRLEDGTLAREGDVVDVDESVVETFPFKFEAVGAAGAGDSEDADAEPEPEPEPEAEAGIDHEPADVLEDADDSEDADADADADGDQDPDRDRDQDRVSVDEALANTVPDFTTVLQTGALDDRLDEVRRAESEGDDRSTVYAAIKRRERHLEYGESTSSGGDA